MPSEEALSTVPLEDVAADDDLDGQPDARELTGATGARARRFEQRLSLKGARASAIEVLGAKGHRDRKTGTFGVPEVRAASDGNPPAAQRHPVPARPTRLIG